MCWIPKDQKFQERKKFPNAPLMTQSSNLRKCYPKGIRTIGKKLKNEEDCCMCPLFALISPSLKWRYNDSS